MIENKNFINIAINNAKKANIGDRLIFYTYKKDRKIIIIKHKDDFSIEEHGFEKNIFENIEYKKIKKILKTLGKREFPRSNKLWFEIEKTAE